MSDARGEGARAPGLRGPGLTPGAGRPSHVTRDNIFRHHDAHPFVLDWLLIDRFGGEWFSWEPETLWASIKTTFQTPSIHDQVRSKIQAVRTAHITEWVWTKWEVFCPVVQALNNNVPDFQVLRKPEPAQLFVAVDTLNDLRREDWSREVRHFVASALLDRGIALAPAPIDFAQPSIDQYLKDHSIDGESAAVRTRYAQVKDTPLEQVALEENAVDVQVCRLVIAHDYMKMRRSQKRIQLETVR